MCKENMTTNVNICYAVDENYAFYLKVSLFSLLKKSKSEDNQNEVPNVKSIRH